jgi:hypothetical protein
MERVSRAMTGTSMAALQSRPSATGSLLGAEASEPLVNALADESAAQAMHAA